MNYNQTTRDELYRKFTDSHQPGKMFNLLYGSDSRAVFHIFTTATPRWSKEDKDLFEKLCKAMEVSICLPGFFR